jgi:RNA polymerase sigma factor (sigma-70 family)
MNFEEQLNNNDNKKIMFAVCYRYRRFLDEDDAESIKLQTLWECCQKYDPYHPKRAKFTSYLYDRLNNKIRNHLKKKKREIACAIPEDAKVCQSSNLEFHILNSLNDEDKNILTQSYMHNMTIEEIGRANGYSRETARRKLHKIRAKCKELLAP